MTDKIAAATAWVYECAPLEAIAASSDLASCTAVRRFEVNGPSGEPVGAKLQSPGGSVY
jgi:hypothetical protein